MIKSRYNPLQLFLVVFFGLLFILSPVLLFRDSTHLTKLKFLLALLPLMGALLIYNFFEINPMVIFDGSGIQARYFIWNKRYEWSSVQDVYLSKKESYFLQAMEATVIVLDNGKKLILAQDIYKNCKEMRGFISEKAGGKIRDPRPNIISINLQTINRRRYSGNVYTSLNTLMLVGVAIFWFVALWHTAKRPPLLFPLGFMTIWFFLAGTQMNYFLIDEGSLFVKNHYFPWKNIKISLGDILEVDMETPDKRSTGLRVMLKDFSSKIYGAGSLRSNNWEDLLNDLRLIGIPARVDR